MAPSFTRFPLKVTTLFAAWYTAIAVRTGLWGEDTLQSKNAAARFPSDCEYCASEVFSQDAGSFDVICSEEECKDCNVCKKDGVKAYAEKIDQVRKLYTQIEHECGLDGEAMDSDAPFYGCKLCAQGCGTPAEPKLEDKCEELLGTGEECDQCKQLYVTVESYNTLFDLKEQCSSNCIAKCTEAIAGFEASKDGDYAHMMQGYIEQAQEIISSGCPN